MKKAVLCLAALVLAALIISGCTSFDGSSLLGGGGGANLFTPKFLYSGQLNVASIDAYAVNATTGALSALPGSPFASDNNPLFLGTNGTSLVFANIFVANAIDSNTVGASGALTSSASATFGTARFTQSAVTPDGRFYVAPDLNGNVYVFTIGASGALTPVAGAPFAGTGMKNNDSIAISPDGKFVYCSNEGVSQVNAFSLNSTTGALTEIPGSPFAASGPGFSVAVTADGKYVYSTDETNKELNGFSINPTTGVLTAIAGSPFGAGTSGTFVTVDPKSKFVYTTGSGGLNGFAIGSNGALTLIPGSPFPTPAASMYFVLADPSGKFLYAGDRANHQIFGFSIGTTGALTAVAGSPFGSSSGGPGGMVITH